MLNKSFFTNSESNKNHSFSSFMTDDNSSSNDDSFSIFNKSRRNDSVNGTNSNQKSTPSFNFSIQEEEDSNHNFFSQKRKVSQISEAASLIESNELSSDRESSLPVLEPPIKKLKQQFNTPFEADNSTIHSRNKENVPTTSSNAVLPMAPPNPLLTHKPTSRDTPDKSNKSIEVKPTNTLTKSKPQQQATGGQSTTMILNIQKPQTPTVNFHHQSKKPMQDVQPLSINRSNPTQNPTMARNENEVIGRSPAKPAVHPHQQQVQKQQLPQNKVLIPSSSRPVRGPGAMNLTGIQKPVPQQQTNAKEEAAKKLDQQMHQIAHKYDHSINALQSMEPEETNAKNTENELNRTFEGVIEDMTRFTEDMKNCALRYNIEMNRMMMLDCPMLKGAIAEIQCKFAHLFADDAI